MKNYIVNQLKKIRMKIIMESIILIFRRSPSPSRKTQLTNYKPLKNLYRERKNELELKKEKDERKLMVSEDIKENTVSDDDEFNIDEEIPSVKIPPKKIRESTSDYSTVSTSRYVV